MLAPRDTPTRERKLLDGPWRFALDADGVGRSEDWYNGLPPGARGTPFPASYNDVFADAAARDHVGARGPRPPCASPPGGQATGSWRASPQPPIAPLWFNGTQVAEHEGGYTSFEADVTGVELNVAVDPSWLRRGDTGRTATEVFPRAGQESPVRRDLEYRQRARVRYPGVASVLQAAGGRGAPPSITRVRSASST
jgi:hypothetical protein